METFNFKFKEQQKVRICNLHKYENDLNKDYEGFEDTVYMCCVFGGKIRYNLYKLDILIEEKFLNSL